jgi:hypothetical protein
MTENDRFEQSVQLSSIIMLNYVNKYNMSVPKRPRVCARLGSKSELFNDLNPYHISSYCNLLAWPRNEFKSQLFVIASFERLSLPCMAFPGPGVPCNLLYTRQCLVFSQTLIIL